MAKSSMKGDKDDLSKDFNPNGTKLKLVQCVDGSPAPICKSKKACSKDMKKVSKCFSKGDDCTAAGKWLEEAKDDDVIPKSVTGCWKACKTSATAPGV